MQNKSNPNESVFYGGSVLFIIGFIIALSSLGLLANNTTAGIFLLISGVTLAVIGFYLIRLYKSEQGKEESDSIKKQFSKATADLAEFLQQINYSYMLDLPDLTKETDPPSPETPVIVYADNPFSAFADALAPETPSRDEFIMKTQRMLTNLLDEMRVSSEIKIKIYSYFTHTLIEEVDDEIVAQVAESFGSELPMHLYFLKNKINYELACLGFIMQYGIDTHDSNITGEVTRLRYEKGYLKI